MNNFYDKVLPLQTLSSQACETNFTIISNVGTPVSDIRYLG